MAAAPLPVAIDRSREKVVVSLLSRMVAKVLLRRSDEVVRSCEFFGCGEVITSRDFLCGMREWTFFGCFVI